MATPYPVMTIAKWFVAWANAEGADLSNLKLQKLLYYAQGWHLGRTGQPLFCDEIQAWSHGPVVPSVYRAFKSFGSGDIELPETDGFQWVDVDADTTDLLIQVWNTYGEFGAWRLRNMTHDEAPWREHFRADERDRRIPQEDMRAFFARLAPSI